MTMRARRATDAIEDDGSIAEPGPAFLTTEEAAQRLGIDVDSLRGRCRRAAKRVGGSVVAHLGGGIVAFKFGHHWRVRFPKSGCGSLGPEPKTGPTS